MFVFETEVLEGTETQMSKTSKINLIDLAGSERASSALNDEVISSKETYDLRLKVGCPYHTVTDTILKIQKAPCFGLRCYKTCLNKYLNTI